MFCVGVWVDGWMGVWVCRGVMGRMRGPAACQKGRPSQGEGAGRKLSQRVAGFEGKCEG